VCLIVDTNLAARVFAEPSEADFAPILDWLERDGCLVVGGPLAGELARIERARRYLLGLLRAGRARRIPDVQVDEERRTVEDMDLCRSNDIHVLALARASGARVVCTHDRDLQRDFRNPAILSRPRGSVYQRREHARLLRHSSSCGLRVRGRRRGQS
jgi:predicted nucleic acid-binding protein